MAISTINVPQAVTYPGAVLQVVQSTYNTTVTNNGVSYISTGLTATITPKFATSKILVMTCQPIAVYANVTASGDIGCDMALNRNATTVFRYYLPIYFYGVNSYNWELTGSGDFVYLDSPATTSAITYQTFMAGLRSGSQTNAQWQGSNCPSTMTLMEIAA